MKRKLFRHILLPFSLVLSLLLLIPLQVNAEGNGGAINTKGEITLVDEGTTPTTSSTSEPKTTDTTDKPMVVKPKGRYPSTGELVKTSLSISGIALVLIIAFLYFQKRKKEIEGKGN